MNISNKSNNEDKKISEENNKIASIVNNSVSHHSRLANKFVETSKVRIYLLNTQAYHDFAIGMNDTIRDLKTKILAHLEKESKTKIKYHVVDAYELRMVEDDDDIIPNMEFPAFDDKLNIIKSKKK